MLKYLQRLNTALINTEVTEASNKSLLNELQEAQTTISALSAHRTKSVGLDLRLGTALRDLEDLRQERDSSEQRAKTAEARTASLSDRCCLYFIIPRQRDSHLHVQLNCRPKYIIYMMH